MFRSSVATESSGEWGSALDAVGSTDSDSAPANRNDGSLSDQVNASSHADHVVETTIPTVISSLSPSFPPATVPLKTESSGEWTSAQDRPRSTDSDTAPANRNDSSSSSKVDKADMSSHATGNGSHNTETTIPTVVSPLTPPFPPPTVLSKPASLIGGSSADPTNETHVRIDENKSQSAYPPSDGTNTQQLPQLSPLLVPVRRLSQIQPDTQAQSTMTSPTVPQNASTNAGIPVYSAIPQEHSSQYSQDVPTAQTPPSRAGGDIPASSPSSPRMPHRNPPNPPQFFPQPTSHFPQPIPHFPQPIPHFPQPTPQRHTTPLRQSVNTPSAHYGTPSQTNRPHGAIAQLYSSGPARPIVPQSATPQFYSLPNAPTPQAQSIHVGTPPRFLASPHSYSLPGAVRTPQTHSSHTGTPQGQPTHGVFPPGFVPQPIQRSASPYSFSNTRTPQTHSSHAGTPQVQPTHAAFPPGFVPPSYNFPNTSAPTLQSTRVGWSPGVVPQFVQHSVSPHSYSLPNAPTPQTHSSHTGTPQQFVPLYGTPISSTPQAQSTPPYLYGLPNAPTPQSIHTPPFISQTPDSRFGHVPSPHPFSNVSYPPSITQAVKPQARKRMDSFVANDPFQVSHGDDKVDRPPDVLNFDQIPLPTSSPGSKLSLGMVGSPYGSLPSRPIPGGILPPALEAYPYGYSSTQPGIYPTSTIPATQIPLGRPSWPPYPPNQYEEDASGNWGPNYPHVHTGIPPPSPPSSSDSFLSDPQMPSQTPVIPGPHIPSSTQHSPVISEPKSDDSAMWIPALPIHRPSSPSRPADIPYNPHESQTGSDESSSIPYIPPYPLHSKYQYPELPGSSILSRLSRFFRRSYDTQSLDSPPPTVIYPPFKPNTNWHEYEFTKAAIELVWVTLPVQIYLHVLLRLPSLYFSRVARIFEEADMTLPEIKKMAFETASQGMTHEFDIQMHFESSSVSPAYKRLTSTWEFFIDSVMREWKTFNIISVLLLSAILTILQLQGAAEDPLTRYTALFSLICALISLLFGCMYIIRFGSMRKTYKAAEWALEAKKTKTFIWWNVWVLLAMPAIWLTWSILLYIACIMSFVWRSGVTSAPTPTMSDTELLVIRIVITIVLGIGMIYAFLIMTTFRRYGTVMDKQWKQRIEKWIEEEEQRNGKWIDEKATGNQGSYAQPTLGTPQYPPTPNVYPDGSTTYPVPTYDSSPYYQPSFGDAQSRPADTYDSTYPSDAFTPPPEPYWTPTNLPHDPWASYQGNNTWGTHTPGYTPGSYLSPTEPYPTTPTWSPDGVTRFNTSFNARIPSPETTPAPLPPGVPMHYSAGIPLGVAPTIPPVVMKTSRKKKKTHFVFPPSSLPPIPGSPPDRSSNDNKIGSSSKSKNRAGGDDDVPDNKSRVRFRSPLISDQGSVNPNKDMDKVQDSPRKSSDTRPYRYPSDPLEYV